MPTTKEDAKINMMSYTMLTEREEKHLTTLESGVLRFVVKVLASTQRPIWTGGTAGEGRMIRLVVPGQMPPVILELSPSEIPSLTESSLAAMLNAQISRQVK
ncbi:hypothetical protein [Schlesneria paludicola]|uniref:hypothetical protein n=1 Tax=Schlesneria paludicola TaxID=360056 RepID=UPI0004926112|nr:hypothetical protein [Schlesneria paludicola]